LAIPLQRGLKVTIAFQLLTSKLFRPQFEPTQT